MYFNKLHDVVEEGIYVIGFSYPVVAMNQARIRVQISACHSTENIDTAIDAFIRVGKELNVIQWTEKLSHLAINLYTLNILQFGFGFQIYISTHYTFTWGVVYTPM